MIRFPVLWILPLIFLIAAFQKPVAAAAVDDVKSQDCQGRFKNKKPTAEQIQAVLADHWKWWRHLKTLTTPQRYEVGRADLCGADLTGTDLHGAMLDMAFLQGANLQQANLSYAKLSLGTDLRKTKLPDIRGLAFAKNLDRIRTIPESQVAFSELREAFEKAGFRDAERSMTYLVKVSQEAEQQPPELWLNRIFLNWTCGYGLYPGRCFRLLLASAGLMSFVYFAALFRRRGGGLWAVWSPDRVDKSEGQTDPVRLSFAQPAPSSFSTRSATARDPLAGLRPRARPARFFWFIGVARFLKAFGVAFYFSLLSAFHFGWRDLNVGNWIARVQPREYAFRPTGWVRMVSGMQSLASVYLVALWVLSYFGRPFE